MGLWLTLGHNIREDIEENNITWSFIISTLYIKLSQ